MNGLLHHLSITLRLNFRSVQPLIYGYLVPIFFLFAFGAVFKAPKGPPLWREMGQLLTVTVLGGACFGMPTAMVAERERGVWRRYRLLPTAVGGIIVSAMVARFVLVLSAALLQLLLAWLVFWRPQNLDPTPFPLHPWQLLIAFTFVTFAFLGLGLVIATVADSVPAVQALGQAIFLPVIMVGGVGVPMYLLPKWAQHVAGFLPGRYAVEAMQACVNGPGLSGARFGLLALTIIGLAGCLAGANLFRWDAAQKIAGPAKAWVAIAVLAWAAVGLTAEKTGRQVVKADASASGSLATLFNRPPTVAPIKTTAPTTGLSTTSTAADTSPSTEPATIPITELPRGPWDGVTDEQIGSIAYDDVPDDQGTVVPLAADLTNVDGEARKRLETLADQLSDWEPAKVSNYGQRVRNLLSVCSTADVLEDPQEAEIPFMIFERLKSEFPKDKLTRIVGWIVLHPNEGTVIHNLSDLGIDNDVPEELVRERVTLYGKKLLWRLLGKDQAAK